MTLNSRVLFFFYFICHQNVSFVLLLQGWVAFPFCVCSFDRMWLIQALLFRLITGTKVSTSLNEFFILYQKTKKRSLHSCYVRQAKVLLLSNQTTAVVFYFLFSSSSLSSRCVVHAFFSLSISHMHLTVNIFPWLYSTYSVPIYTYMYVQLVVFIYAATAYLKHDLSLLECCLCECYCYSSSRSLMMWPKKLFASAHMIRIWYFHASKEKSMSVAEINSKGIYVNTNC